jgi:hypothetical protein
VRDALVLIERRICSYLGKVYGRKQKANIKREIYQRKKVATLGRKGTGGNSSSALSRPWGSCEKSGLCARFDSAKYEVIRIMVLFNLFTTSRAQRAAMIRSPNHLNYTQRNKHMHAYTRIHKHIHTHERTHERT